MPGDETTEEPTEDENPEEVDFDALMEAIKEKRDERKEQVSYNWVETIREAGELYRDTRNIEAVTEELDEPEYAVREALTVYRLIFEDPPEEVAVKASTPSRRFFSLERHDVESLVDEDEEEPIEELLREYVGAAYLEHDIDSEPVGEPPERSNPPMAVDFSELAEELRGGLPTAASLFESSAISGLQEAIDPYPTGTIGSVLADYPQNTVADAIVDHQANTVAGIAADYPGIQVADMMGTLVDDHQQLISGIAGTALLRQNEMYRSITDNAIRSVLDSFQIQQNLLSPTLSAMVTEIQFPQPVLSDLASIQMSFSTAATGVATPSTGINFTETAESSASTVDYEPAESEFTQTPSVSPAGATLDATLLGSGEFTTELVFEIPMMVTNTILSTGRTRIWFSDLHEDYQIDVVKVVLAAVAVYLTGNLAMAGLAVLPARSVRRFILSDEE